MKIRKGFSISKEEFYFCVRNELRNSLQLKSL